jgi:hypothetical protein
VNWLVFMCRVGTTVAAVAGTAAAGAAAGALSGSFGGPVGAASGAVAGAGIGVVGGLAKSGEICDQAAHDMYMRQKCEALDNGEMYVKVQGKQLATVKQLAERGLMPTDYYKDIGACEEAGHLPKSRPLSTLPTDSKGMVLP